MLTESENLKYQLESLASYEPSDLDNPEFDVGYEDNNSNECFATVCCIDVAKRALERINELEQKELTNDVLVMSNARRLIKAHKATSNARLCMELFGTGYGTARDYCRKLKLDPDSNLTPFK